MLKNKLKFKRIRNICIFIMAFAILWGVYTNVRKSQAENVIPIQIEIADKNEAIEMQTITVEAIGAEDGSYHLNLPTSVQGLIVNKYYIDDATEIDMKDESTEKTIVLTDEEIANQKMQIETDYDKKEITTEDNQTITLYNKELMDIKEPEENTEETNNQEEQVELDDSVIVTGYMPLEAQIEVNEIDLGTLPEIQLPNETQTIEKAYEISVYQTHRKVTDAEGNVVTDEIVTPKMTEEINSENAKENENVASVTEATTDNSTTVTTIQLKDGTRIEEEKIEYDPSIYNEQITVETKNETENTIGTVYNLQEDNQVGTVNNIIQDNYVNATFEKSNETVKYVLATEPAPVENNDAMVSTQSDAGISTLANVPSGLNYLRSTANETTKASPFLGNTSIQRQNVSNVVFLNYIDYSYSNMWDVSEAQNGSIMAWYDINLDGSYLVYIGTEVEDYVYANPDSSYLFAYIGYQYKLENVVTINHLYLFRTTYVTDMSHMFYYTGYSSSMTSLDLGEYFDTSNVTNMSAMFMDTGYNAMTNLDLGDKFDTSNVTDMSNMFCNIGYKAMTSLDLGDKFDTSNATDMSGMFKSTGRTAMASLDLGDKFDTSKVTNMSEMFYQTGRTAMTSLDLGDKFDTSKVTTMTRMFYETGYTAMTSLDLGSAFINIASNNSSMFYNTGESGQIVIRVPEAIYQDEHHVKLNETSTTTIEFTRGTFEAIKINYLRSTASETTSESGFLGNTNLQRALIDTVIFESSTSGANDTAWDVSEEQDGSIIAYYIDSDSSRGTKRVFICSDEEIYANPDSSYLFAYIGLISIFPMTEAVSGLELLNTSKVTNMSHMFYSTGYGAMTSLDLGDNFDTSNVTDMSYMFQSTGYMAMTSLDLGNKFNTSKVTNMMWMFYETGYTAMTSLNLGENFDTSKVTNMSYMFAYTGRNEMTSLDLGNKFDTSKVTSMSGMFNNTGYIAMTSLDLKDKFDTSSVTNMNSMFEKTGYTAMQSLDLGDKFDTSDVTDMGSMFYSTGYKKMISLELGNNFNTSNVTTMSQMFYETGYTSMTSLDLGDKFDTSKVTNMYSMFEKTGYKVMTSLDLGNKFDTSSATRMKYMFLNTGYTSMQSLDLGPAFIKIASDNSSMFTNTGRSNLVIMAPEAIYNKTTQFKLGTDSTSTITYTRGIIVPWYRTEWIKQGVTVNTSSKNVQITLRGRTNAEAGTDYVSNLTSSLAVGNIKIYIDGTDVTNIVTKSLGSATQVTNSTTGAKDVQQILTLSNLEEATRRTGKDYTEWSGNIRIEIPQGTLDDVYGNSNMSVASDGSREDNIIQDTTTDKNTSNTLFADVIKPEFTYEFSSTDINQSTKTLTVDFTVADKYFNTSTVTSNANNITVKMADTNTAPQNLTKTLRKVSDVTDTVNGTSKKVGENYRLTISGFEQASVNNGKYTEYSGPVSISFPANMVTDKSGNKNNAKTITVGIDEPDGTGDEEIVDFIDPDIEKISSSVDAKNKTAQLKFSVTDKYLQNSTLAISNIQVLVNGSVNSSIQKQISSTTLTEQRTENGSTITATYGREFTLNLSNINTNVNQIKVRIPANAITDTSGNGNEQVDMIVYNTLRSTSSERIDTSRFLENTSIERENIDNVTFMPSTSGANSTQWDVSAQGDDSILAWYTTNSNGTYKVYIGSNDEIFGNVDSSYLFSYIGYGNNCTSAETITNLILLNTSNVTNMAYMFNRTGYKSMTSLDLGDNFDTSSVTNMRYMFAYTGYNAMTSLDLGDKFDTSNVTSMNYMFSYTGYTAMTSLELGDKFDTSKVTDMTNMFERTGYTAMTSLELGDKFDTSNVTNMSYMFAVTGYTAMTSLELGDKFDTSNVTNMDNMFYNTGAIAMISLDLGDKFNTSNVTSMNSMFQRTGYTAMPSLDLGDNFDTSNVTKMSWMFDSTGGTAMTTLDLGPAFTNVSSSNLQMFSNTGKSGSIVIHAPESIFQDSTHFKLNTSSSTTISFKRGSINPKYRTEWVKQSVTVNTTNKNVQITLRGRTNEEAGTEYVSNVTSSLAVGNIKIYIDDTDITNIVTKSLGSATQVTNSTTNAKDVQQVLTLSNLEEASRRSGKQYTEWSGNIRIEITQGNLADSYGNKNMALADDGSRASHQIEDTAVDKNTSNTLFADFIKPEFTYTYSSTDINYNAKSLTVQFSVTDKYFSSSTVASSVNNITIKMADTNTVPENLTKNLTKVSDINETRNGSNVKIGETYKLVITGWEQASIENGKYKEYSGPVSITFPANIVTDKSNNKNNATTITVGINEPTNTGTKEIVDVVNPVWEAKNIVINKAGNKVTVDLYGTDKYYASNSLNVNNIKVIIDGQEITSSTNVTKQLSTATALTETRNGVSEQYGVKYTLTLSNWKETNEQFSASGRIYREYSGNTQIQINAGTLVDESGNKNTQTTLDLGKIDYINPDILKVSSTKNATNKTETIVFDVIDKDLKTVGISTTDTSKISVYVDGESATGVTKQITSVQDLSATINGASKVVGKRYTLVLSNFEQTRSTTVNYNREYSDWSGVVTIKISAGTATDNSGNASEEASIAGDFVDFIKPNATYQYSSTDVDHDGKTFTMVFDITDKFYTSETLALEDLTILIDGEEPDWNEVDKSLQETNRTNTVNGTSKVIGKRYTLTLSNLEQLQVKEGENYLDYSGVVTVAIPANKITDTTGNANDALTITSGINLPSGTGTEEVVDVVQPLVEKVSSSVDAKAKTATLTFKATDKYFENSTLTNTNIQVLVNGTVNTTITKQLTSGTPLNEQRMVNGVNSTVQYGVQYTVNLSGIDTTVNQIKIRVPAGTVTDENGNSNEETDLMMFNTLRSASTEIGQESGFLGNHIIQRQNIDNVTFMSSTSGANNTQWDVSAMQDDSIIAWYTTNSNGTVKVYIGSNDEIFGNVNSSYLFSYIGYAGNCTSTETITNIDLLNTSNVTNMSYMFYGTGNTAMTSLDLGDNFDTSNVTDMKFMFMFTGFEAMTSLNLGDKFDTNKVENMRFMFTSTGYSAMTSLNLGDEFDTSNVTNMAYMFSQTGYAAMTSLDLGDKFDTSNVTNMSSMFDITGYGAMTSLDLGDKFDTSNVTTMSYMFRETGYTAMTSLDLGDKFDTSNVTNMSSMFSRTGYTAMTSLDLGDNFDTSSVRSMAEMFDSTGYTSMTSLDLGDKFDTSNVTDMTSMFYQTGYQTMTSLDLGPAFTKITENNQFMMMNTGKSGSIVIQAPEAIYQSRTSFKLNTSSSTTIAFTRGTINPKYRTEWTKQSVTVNTTNKQVQITLRGTTNTEVEADEYVSNVTSSLAVGNIKIYIDDTDVTSIVTKSLGNATTTSNTRTGAQDVLQTLTISNLEQAERLTGKQYKEWSGNIRIEIAQGTLTDTTGPADENGKTIPYGNKNMEVASEETQNGATTGAGSVTEIGARIDNILQDTAIDKNTANTLFADFIKPEFTYNYSAEDINYDAKSLTVEFSVTDKYFNTATIVANNITIKMLDTNTIPENLEKTLTKVGDINETRNGTNVKIGETYKLVVTGWEQASIENGKYKEYSGPVSIAFPASITTDKSGNSNGQKTITIGINEPDQSGTEEIVDVVTPVWEAKNVQIDKANNKVTVDLYGTDKYYASNSLDISKIKVIIDGEEVTSTANVTKQLSSPSTLSETRNGVSTPYGVKYTLTLSNWKESDTVFQASEKPYREYSGNTKLQIDAGTLVDESGNQSIETTLNIGKIDIINPEMYQISSTKNDANKTDTIVFEVVDKYFESAQISSADTSKLTVFVDGEEAIGVTKTITNEEDITAVIDGISKVVGKRYTLVVSNFEQPRTEINYDREYSDWSGDVTVEVDPGTIVDDSGNTN